jgi:hypothetical protein
MKRLALIASALAIVPAAFAQTLLKQSAIRTNFYGPAGVTTAWNGQPANTSWDAWPERGGEYVLTGAGVATEIVVPYIMIYSGAPTGEQVTVNIYAMDGPAMNSDLGNGPYPSPGTLLHSATVALNPANGGRPSDDCYVRIPLPNVNLPQNVFVGVWFNGGVFVPGPYDPATNTNHAGFRFCGTPEIGTAPQSARNVNPNTLHGRVWRRVRVAGVWSGWGCDESLNNFPPFNPNFPGPISYGMGCTINSGNVHSYDNAIGQNESGFYRPYPEFDQLTGALLADTEGHYVLRTGTTDTLTQIDLPLAGDTLSNPNATFVFSIYQVAQDAVFQKVPGALVWQSAAQNIPNGLDPNGSNTFLATMAVPNVVLPREMFYTIQFNFGNPPAPGNCGPITRLTTVGPPAVGQLAPQPGLAEHFAAFNRFDLVAGTWGGFFYPPNGWDQINGFQIEINGLAACTFTCAGANPFSLPPAAEARQRGRADAGNNLGKLAADDGVANQYCKFIVPNEPNWFLDIRWRATCPTQTPSALTYRVKSKMAAGQAGLYQTTVRAFNYDTNLTDESRQDVHNTSYATRDLVLTGNLARYVKDADGEMQMHYEVRQTGPGVALIPCSDVDLVSFIGQ